MGCNRSNGPIIKTIELNEELGKINIPIPTEYDTLLIWDDRTDYHCGTEHKKRFANAEYLPVMESGFISRPYPDSVYQITIFNNPIGCNKTITEKENTLEFYKKQLEQTGTYKFMFQEKIEIHGKPAIIFGFRLGEYSGKRKDVYKEVCGQENLELYIEHKNQMVTVKFECSGNNCSDYIKESRKLTDEITFDE